MRLRIFIKARKIPMLHRHRVVSLLKEALRRASPEYKEEIFTPHLTRPFNFNLLLPRSKNVYKGRLQIEPGVEVEDTIFELRPSDFASLFLSTLDYTFAITFFNGIRQLKYFAFSTDDTMLIDGEPQEWEIAKVMVLKERPITDSTVVFRTCSPFIIENEKDQPILFYEQNFEQELNELMDRIFQSPHIKGKGLSKPLKLQPIKMQKQVARTTFKEFRMKTGRPIMFLTGNSGTFRLSGDPEDLNIIYRIGLGNRTSQGFGMVEVLQ